MRRLISALVLAAVLALGAACGAPAAAPRATVEYSGCRARLEPSGVCILRSKRELRLWVEAPRENRIELRIDGRAVTAASEPVDGGQRFTLTLPAGARELAVRVPGEPATATWSLRLGEASPDAKPPEGQRDVVAEIDQQTAQIYRQLRARDLAAARATLATLSLSPDAPGESRYLLAYYRGLLAEREGDFRTALAEIHRAIEIAQRVKPERYLWLAEEELALLLRGIGRSRDAALLFERLRQTPYAGNACEEAQLLNNLAWSTLLAREAGDAAVGGEPGERPIGSAPEAPGDPVPVSKELRDPAPFLETALAKYASCASADPEQKVNVLINLALARLQQGDLTAARALLQQAHGLEPHPPLPHRLWSLDIEGRLALEEAHPRAALDRFAELAELATETGSFDGRLRAALGEARSRRALGDTAGALGGLDAADALLDAQSLQIPIDAGRETFLAARRALVDLHVALLLDAGRNADALAATRRARSRVLRQLAHVDALASLSSDERARRTRLLTDYQQRRAALEQRARDDWKLPADELRHERAARKAEAVEVQALLDAAYGVAAAGAAAGPPAPRPGELMLIYQPLAGETWVAFAADRDAVEARRFTLPARTLPAPEALAEQLLLPFSARIARATRLRVLASGRLADVDVHALPFAGQPLLAARPVVYGLDLPADLASDRASAREHGPRGQALLISDARGDLPGARAEAATVGAALRSHATWSVAELSGTGASAEAVRAHLATSDLLHYAGHGDYSGEGGWESSLLLADGTRLTLGDLLALERVPAWVALSGCETGRVAGDAPVAGLGLAQAFLLAGSRSVIAATRPADDRRVPAFFADLYRHWPEEPDLAVAMQRAQLAFREQNPTDWSIFRLFER